MKVTLQHMAHVRSGDKGNTSNIAVFVYEPKFYDVLRDQLTAERFKAFYRGAIKGPVTRFEVANIEAFNFVCEAALGGGVSRNLALDNYGKALSSAILGFELEVPEDWLGDLRGTAPNQSDLERRDPNGVCGLSTSDQHGLDSAAI